MSKIIKKSISPCESCPFDSTCTKPCNMWQEWFSMNWNEVKAIFQKQMEKEQDPMYDQIQLLQSELKTLKINLERAKARPGVTEEELTNLERKIKLKEELLKYLQSNSNT